MKTYVNIIKQFPTKESKKYWINALKVSDTVKGKLLKYFNLV